MFKFEVSVCKLSILGLRFIAGILGLMKDGEEGSDIIELVDVVAATGGCMERPFMLRGRRGDGDVMGRKKEPASGALMVIWGLFKEPNVVEG